MDKDEHIRKLEKALTDIEEKANNWNWGHDGDCGLSLEIGFVIDTVMPERTN